MEAIVIFSNPLVRKPYFQYSSRPSSETCLHRFSNMSSRPTPRRPFSGTGTCKVAPEGGPGAKTGLPRTPPGVPEWCQNRDFCPWWHSDVFGRTAFLTWRYPPPGPKNLEKTCFWETLRGQFSIATVTPGGKGTGPKEHETPKFSTATVTSLHTATTTACENGPAPGSPQNHPSSPNSDLRQ